MGILDVGPVQIGSWLLSTFPRKAAWQDAMLAPVMGVYTPHGIVVLTIVEGGARIFACGVLWGYTYKGYAETGDRGADVRGFVKAARTFHRQLKRRS